MSTVSTDPIADMLTRIRNAINVRKTDVILPHSNVKQAIAELLVANKFIDDAKVVDGTVGKMLKVTVHDSGTNARITEITRLSKPGRRWYVSADEIPTVKRGRGIVVVSTSKGLMTDKQARQQHLGGELICKVY
jgi:small subunit ribosomal protein S8